MRTLCLPAVRHVVATPYSPVGYFASLPGAWIHKQKKTFTIIILKRINTKSMSGTVFLRSLQSTKKRHTIEALDLVECEGRKIVVSCVYL